MPVFAPPAGSSRAASTAFQHPENFRIFPTFRIWNFRLSTAYRPSISCFAVKDPHDPLKKLKNVIVGTAENGSSKEIRPPAYKNLLWVLPLNALDCIGLRKDGSHVSDTTIADISWQGTRSRLIQKSFISFRILKIAFRLDSSEPNYPSCMT